MKYVLSLLLTVCFFSFSAKSNGTGKDIDVNHYEIHLKDFNSVEKSIVASTTITLTALNDIEKIELNLRSLTVTSVVSEEINVKDFSQNEDILTINLSSTLSKDSKISSNFSTIRCCSARGGIGMHKAFNFSFEIL